MTTDDPFQSVNDLFGPEGLAALLTDAVCQYTTGDHDRTVATIETVAERGWTDRFLYTLAALFAGQHRHSCPSGGQLALIRNTVDEPAWAGLFRMLAQSILQGDGATLQACFDTVLAMDDPKHRIEIQLSLVASVTESVARHRADPRHMNMRLLLGCDVHSGPMWETAGHLVDGMIACLDRDGDTVHTVLHRIDDTKSMGDALTLGVHCLSRMLPDDDDVTMFTANVEPGQSIPDIRDVTGFLVWKDESLDAGREPAELAACQVMRMATFWRQGRSDQVLRIVQQVGGQRPMVGQMVFAVMNFLSDMVARRTNTAERQA